MEFVSASSTQVNETRVPRRGAGRYNLVRPLSNGAYGSVVLAHDMYEDKLVAIKYISRGTNINEYVYREVLNHRKLLNHHIIRFKEVFLTVAHLCIVMEYVGGGNMLGYLNKHRYLPEPKARWYFQQLIFAIDYSHKRGVALRDIKLENAVLDDSDNTEWPILKLCDFGFSKDEYEHSLADTNLGTLPYAAPEIIENYNNEKYDGKKCDIWSAGVFLYLMLVGRYPFGDPGTTERDRLQVAMKILNVAYAFPENLKFSDQCIDFISKLLEKDPSKRYCIDQIKKHPWFQQNLPHGIEINEAEIQNNFAGFQREEDIRYILDQAQYKAEISPIFDEKNLCIESKANTL